MWAECIDCNAVTKDFGHKVYFKASEKGWNEFQRYLEQHGGKGHDVDCYVADYRDDDKCPYPSCA